MVIEKKLTALAREREIMNAERRAHLASQRVELLLRLSWLRQSICFERDPAKRSELAALAAALWRQAERIQRELDEAPPQPTKEVDRD